MPDGGVLPCLALTPERSGRLLSVVSRPEVGCTHLAPLVLAASTGATGLIFMERNARSLQVKAALHIQGPLVVIVHDDDGHSSGPDGFQWRRLFEWAGAVLLHGAGAEHDHGMRALDLVQAHKRLLLVETSSEQAEHWFNAMRRAIGQRRVPGVIILPKGGLHPIEMEARH